MCVFFTLANFLAFIHGLTCVYVCFIYVESHDFPGLINGQFRFIVFLTIFSPGLIAKIPNSDKFHFKNEQNLCGWHWLIFSKYSFSSLLLKR